MSFPFRFCWRAAPACWESSVIIWAHQRSLDVKPERVRHVGDSASDPAKPGNGGDCQQHAAVLHLRSRPLPALALLGVVMNRVLEDGTVDRPR